jgi:hypothetical protein
MEQNYFQFDQQYYKQTDGLPMGAPTSLLAEIYIQPMEHKQIYCHVVWSDYKHNRSLKVAVQLLDVMAHPLYIHGVTIDGVLDWIGYWIY